MAERLLSRRRRGGPPLQGPGGAGGALEEDFLEGIPAGGVAAAAADAVARQRRQQRQPIEQILRARSLQDIHPDSRQLPILQPRLCTTRDFTFNPVRTSSANLQGQRPSGLHMA